MRALLLRDGGLVKDEVELPKIENGEVLIKVHSAGICHTELHFLDSIIPAPNGIILGHEIAGEVEEIKGDSDLKKGDRVVLYYYQGCGQCNFCKTGEENLCPRPKLELGFMNNGGFAQYVKAPIRNAIRIPDQISFEEAAPIGCSVTTAIHATSKASIKEGDTVVVYGVGGVGFQLIQYNRLKGAKVIAVSRNQKKLELAKELGATEVVNPLKDSLTKKVHEITKGNMADVVYDLVGTKESYNSYIRAVGRKGRVVLIGYEREKIEMNPLYNIVREITVTASVGNTLDELREGLRLVAEGKMKILIDKVVSLDKVGEALEEYKKGNALGRIVADPWL
ncbi:zinc-dependent alcohol dehydrogenase [Sulfolobales archaeon HS-7]|nr:zinc-dependent alcohol dehydrogenase [Sulfolobales archaeon HS-7]